MKLLKQLSLADYVSLLSLAASWFTIILIIENQPNFAIIATCIAFLLDTLDGYLARKHNTATQFGRELDSAVDIINYLGFSVLFSYFFLFSNSILAGIVGLFILTFGILRIVRLNVEGIKIHKGKKYYEGVVTTHISPIVIIFYFLSMLLPFSIEIPAALCLIVLSVLMISRIKTYKPSTYFSIYMLTSLFILGAVYFEFFS